MFIGEGLNERQVACLQAVAHACGGAQYASFESILGAIKDHRECRVLLDESHIPQGKPCGLD